VGRPRPPPGRIKKENSHSSTKRYSPSAITANKISKVNKQEAIKHPSMTEKLKHSYNRTKETAGQT
jgi:hypothetical protein